MGDGVAEIFHRDEIGFKDLVDDEGGAADYTRKTGFGEGAVRKYYFASERLQAHAVDTSVSEALVATNTQLRKANKKLRDQWAQYTKALATYRSARTYVPPVSYTPKQWHDPEIAIACIGDTQIGALVLPEHTGGLESYSWEVFKHRAETYKEKFNICTEVIRRSVPLDVCYILLLGDMGEGEGIFPLQHSKLDALAWEQLFYGTGVVADIIENASRLYDKVVVFCVWGNHGRTQGSTFNLDQALYAFLKKDLAPLENVTVHISGSHFLLFYVGPELGILDYEERGGKRWIYCILHGDTVRGWMGVPAYGMYRASWRYMAATDVHIYKMICGHHHEEATGSRWIINPSWVAASDYSMGTMQGCSQPMQLFLTHHARLGLTSMRHLYLDDAPSLRDAEIGPDGILTPIIAEAV